MHVLTEIREGKFRPDVTRSGRFLQSEPSVQPGEKPSQTKIEIDSEEECGWKLIEPHVPVLGEESSK